MVDGGEFPCHRIRRLVGCGGSHAKAYGGGSSGHSRYAVEGVVDGELGGGWNGGVEICGAPVYVVAAENVGKEDGVEFGGFEFLGEEDPVLNGVVGGSLV